MQYNFDEIICRKNTNSSKWDSIEACVGNADAIPMWVADADFVAEQEVDGCESESDYGERNECGCVVGLC